MQRDTVVALHSECREFAVMLDLWHVFEEREAETSHSLKATHSTVYVLYLGGRWGEGDHQAYVHVEPEPLARGEFQEKLRVLYEPTFGPDLAFVESEQRFEQCSILFFPVRRLDASHFQGEVVGATPHLRTQVMLSTEEAPHKRRLRVVKRDDTALSAEQSQVLLLRHRAAGMLEEAARAVPEPRLLLMLSQALNEKSPWWELVTVSVTPRDDVSSQVRVALYDYLHAIRQGLALLSEGRSEETTRHQALLCRRFLRLAIRVVDHIGAPVPPPNASKCLFSHHVLHTFVASAQRYRLLQELPSAAAEDQLFSPSATMRVKADRRSSMPGASAFTRSSSSSLGRSSDRSVSPHRPKLDARSLLAPEAKPSPKSDRKKSVEEKVAVGSAPAARSLPQQVPRMASSERVVVATSPKEAAVSPHLAKRASQAELDAEEKWRQLQAKAKVVSPRKEDLLAEIESSLDGDFITPRGKPTAVAQQRPSQSSPRVPRSDSSSGNLDMGTNPLVGGLRKI